jgi:hypothetical protein
VIIFLNSTNQLTYVTETHCVLFEVGNEILNKMNFMLQRVEQMYDIQTPSPDVLAEVIKLTCPLLLWSNFGVKSFVTEYFTAKGFKLYAQPAVCITNLCWLPASNFSIVTLPSR